MDYGKDINKSEGLVKFFESQSSKTNPFGENRVGERAYRRAERITAALVLITSHVSEKEPIRQRVRAAALNLLENVLALRAEMRAVNSERAQELKASVRELISLSRVLAVAGYASPQNVAILSEALDELTGFLSASQRSTLSEAASYSREDFLDVRESGAPAPRVSRDSRADVIHETDAKETAQVSSRTKSASSEKDSSESKGHSDGGRSARSKVIIEVLRSNGELGIRDIASNLPEFSEKMIQRELAALVHEGAVQKTGEKRWSRYVLKQ